MAKFWSLAGVVVFGIIVADILTHPNGTQAAANGIVAINRVNANALLGQAS